MKCCIRLYVLLSLLITLIGVNQFFKCCVFNEIYCRLLFKLVSQTSCGCIMNLLSALSENLSVVEMPPLCRRTPGYGDCSLFSIDKYVVLNSFRLYWLIVPETLWINVFSQSISLRVLSSWLSISGIETAVYRWALSCWINVTAIYSTNSVDNSRWDVSFSKFLMEMYKEEMWFLVLGDVIYVVGFVWCIFGSLTTLSVSLSLSGLCLDE